MHIVPFADAPPYTAPGHFGLTMKRLQGRDAGPSDSIWMGLTTLAPGGRIEAASSPVEKFYVVVEGEVEVTAVADGRTQVATLRALDSCRIAGGESRAIANTSAATARLLLVMPQT